MNTDNCHQTASAGKWMESFIHLEPFDGNYPYSLKDLFIRVQVLFIRSGPSQSESGVCFVGLNKDSFHSSNSLQSEICRTRGIRPVQTGLVGFHWVSLFKTTRREVHYCGPTLFWDGCKKIQYLGPQILDYKEVCCTPFSARRGCISVTGLHIWSSDLMNLS